MRNFLFRQRFSLAWGSIRLIILEVPGSAADNLLCHHGHPPLGHPAIRAGDVLTIDLDHGSELGIEAGAAFVTLADQAKILVFAMIVIEHAHPAGIGEVAGGAAGNQILFPIALKEGGRFPGVRHDPVVIMDGIFVRHSGVIVGQGGADQLEVGTLKPNIGFPCFLIHMEAEITGVHTKEAKEKILELADQEKAISQIMRELGYDPKMLGHNRTKNLIRQLRIEAETSAGLHNGYKKRAPKRMTNAEILELEQNPESYAKLKTEVIYLREEVEFLKKVSQQAISGKRGK